MKGFDLGGIEDPIAHSNLTVVQEHGHLQIGMQSGTMCTQEPAVPTKLHQDVSKPGVILVSVTVSVSYPVCIVPHTMDAQRWQCLRPPGLVTSLRWFQALKQFPRFVGSDHISQMVARVQYMVYQVPLHMYSTYRQVWCLFQNQIHTRSYRRAA